MAQNLNTENVTDMGEMFYGCNNLKNIDLSGFDTKNVTNMRYMFSGCGSLASLDLSAFNTKNVTNIGDMFKNCRSLQTIYVGDNWTTDAVEYSYGMFYQCYQLTGGNGTRYQSNNQDNASYARIDGGTSAPGYFTRCYSPYAVFSNGTLTFYYDQNKPSGAYGMRTNWEDQWYDDADKISKVVFDKSFADYRPTSCAHWFDGCRNLTTIEGMKEYLNTDNVTSMSSMFSNCSSLTTLDVSNFKTDNVTNMSGMFGDCSSLTTLDVSNFKTEKVTDMSVMFGGCSSLTSLDLSNFNTENVIDMGFMFSRCNSLTTLDVSNFKTDNVTSIGYMFGGCSSLTSLDISNFNTDNVMDMSSMFGNCSNLTTLDVSNFNTEKVTNMGFMFYSCSSLQTIYVGDKWTTKNVTKSEYMFDGCNNLYSGKGTAYNANYTDATYARIDDPENGKPGYLTKSGEQTDESLIPYAVFSDGTLTFYYGKNKPAGAYGMRTNKGDQWYDVADKITKVVFDKSFDNYRPTSCAYWFYSCSNLTIIEGMKEYLNTDNVTSMFCMFESCNNLTSLDVSNFNTEKVIGIWNMFKGCSSLTTLNVSNFKTENVTDMGYMFSGCSSLTTLDVSNFNTEKVTEMNGMFLYCSSLTTLDVSNFNTENVIDMKYMFSNCYNLQTIYVGDNWTTKKVTDSRNMFDGCNNLYGGKGTVYNADFIDATYANIDDPENGKPGYFTKSGEPAFVPPIPYAVFSDGTLTFYYDKNKPAGAYGMRTSDLGSGNEWGKVRSQITKVVFDKSFADYKPTSCAYWFNGCYNLTEFECMANLNTEDVTSMYSMFNGCSSLTTLDVSNFKTDNVTDMGDMFNGCNRLKTLDLSNFDTKNVTTIYCMFANCENLQTIFVGDNWSVESETEDKGLFVGCYDLCGGKGTCFNSDIVTKEYAHIDGGEDNPGYLTKVGEPAFLPKRFFAVLDDAVLTFYYDENIPEGALRLIENGRAPDWVKDGRPTKVVFDPSVADFRPTSCNYWFYVLFNVTEFSGLEYLNTEKVTDMGSMFSMCESLTSLDLSNFNTENVTDMGGMFDDCSSLTSLDLSKFNTEKVTNMNSMFAYCSNLKTIYVGDNWTTKNVTQSEYMFNGCNNLYGGKGTVYNADFIDATYARIDDPENGKPGYFTKSGEQPYENLIPYAVFSDGTLTFYYDKNKPASAYGMKKEWNDEWSDVTDKITKVVFDKSFADYHPTSCADWFSHCRNLTEIEGMKEYLNTEKVTDMHNMFGDCSSLTTLDVSNFKTDNVTDMSGMFGDCSSLTTLDVSNFKTDNVMYMRSMFSGCSSLTSLDLSNFNTENVIDMGFMFYGCSSLQTIYVGDNWTTKNVTSMYWMFTNCSSLTTLDVSNFNTEKVRSMSDMFYNCSSLTTLDVSNFKTDNVTSMDYMFSGCSSLTTLDVSNFKTDNVTNMGEMFDGCRSLTTLDVSNFKTDNVTNMNSMFGGCSSLTSLDLSNFKTDNVTGMDYMFRGCSSLQTIYVGDNWTTKNVTYSGYMFNDCNNLYGGKGTAYNADFIDATYAHIDGGEKNPGYFTKAPKKVINIALTAPKNLNVVEGTALDLTGGKLTISYNDETSEDIPLTNENVTISEFNNSEIGEKTLTVNYNGEKVDDFKINVVAKSVATIRVTKSPEKLNYKKGEVLSVDDGEITVTYNNQTTEILAFTAEGVTISDIDNTKLGAQSITVTYSEKVATFNITVVPDKEILSITISKLPKTEYFAGEDLNISDGELTITYSDKTTETTKLSIAKLSGFNSETVGKQTIKVTYLEKETTFEVNVKAVEIVSIELTTAPTKLEYIENEEFSAEGGEITVTFNNEATQKVALTDEKVSISGFDNSKIGEQTLKVVYSEKETELKVNIVAKSLVKIAISTQPTKVEYLEGENFSADGGEFVAYYNNNSSDTLDLSKATISGFDNSKIGEQTLKVVYNEKETELKVKVVAKSLVKIAISTQPTKVEYLEGETFSADGGEFVAYYNNNSSDTLDLSKATISGFDNSKIGEQTLIVVYSEKETELKVKVVAKSLVKIAISTQPSKVEYLEGEAFSADGGEFVAYYNNNSSDTLDLSKATISGFDNSKIGEQTLKVVYNEKTAEIKVTVSAKPEPQPEPEPEPVVENPYTKPELKDGFYQISTAEELLWFVFDVNSGDTKANAALTEDIVINQDCLERVIKLLGISKADGDLTVWQPIGTFEHAFAGIFDGQGHSISGLFINDKTLDNAGLFGAITSEAVVKNLGVVDSYISGGKNVGAICGQSEGKIENCYSLSEVKGTENVNGIAGKVETVSNVENCYYLADTPNADDPQAKTAAEFKSGEVAQLLAKGDKAWKNVKELPGVESVVVPEPEPQIENPDNPETATEDITLSSVKIWSFEKTIFVENAVNEIVIIDLTGRVVKNVAPDSNRMEIQLNKGGIYIVKTGLSTKKVSVK